MAPEPFLVGFKVEDTSQDGSEDAVRSIVIAAILIAAIVAIFITTSEAFAEVVLILSQTDIVAVVAEGCVLISIRVLIVASPTILTIC